MVQPSSPRGPSAQGLMCLTFSQEICPDSMNKSTRRTCRICDKWEKPYIPSLLALSKGSLSCIHSYDVEDPLTRTHTHTQIHTNMQVLLVQEFMMLVDPLTLVMYFCAVCQLPKCVFWLKSG